MAGDDANGFDGWIARLAASEVKRSGILLPPLWTVLVLNGYVHYSVNGVTCGGRQYSDPFRPLTKPWVPKI